MDARRINVTGKRIGSSTGRARGGTSACGFKSCLILCSLAIKKCSDETDGLHRRQGRELTVALRWMRSTETVYYCGWARPIEAS